MGRINEGPKMSFEEYLDAVNHYWNTYLNTSDLKLRKYLIEILTYLTKQLTKTFKETIESYSGD